MAFLAFTSAQMDADSPWTETVAQLIRTNFDDHESRIGANESLSEAAIRDDFVYPSGSINTDIWDISDAANVSTAQQPDHDVDLDNSGGVNFGAIAASVKKMRVDLDRDHSIVFECRHKSNQSDSTESWFFGLKDASIAATSSTIVTTNDNVIGFRQGTTANTYRAICAKAASSSTLQDDIGNASAWSILKITVVSTGSGAAITVRMYVNGTEVSGSPFTTLANIPLLSLRPVLGESGGGGARIQTIDYCLAYWNARPLSA